MTFFKLDGLGVRFSLDSFFVVSALRSSFSADINLAILLSSIF